MAPGLPAIGEHFGITSETILAMTLSIFLLTFAIGPLFLAPLSEMYGRTWVSSLHDVCPLPRIYTVYMPDSTHWELVLPCI